MMILRDYFKHRPFKSRKILLVDDEADLGWIMKKIIRDAGHKLIYAPDIKTGIVKLQKIKSLDFVLVDLRIRRESGLLFIKNAKKINSRAKIIMISAFGTHEARKKARQLGANYFLDKPLRPERILDMINRASA